MRHTRGVAPTWALVLKVGIPVWIVGLLIIFAFVWSEAPQAASARDRAELAREIKTLSDQARAFTDLFSKTIELVLPSVVSISTTQTVKVQDMPFGPEDFFRFPDPFGFRDLPRRDRSQPRQREYRRPGFGSGFVIDAKEGYIVTNAHVVRDVKDEDIKITLSDGREVATLEVYRDPKTEVAIIKVEPDGLVPLEWGSSDDLRVGEWVIAIGSPMGLGNSATAGIISATSTKGRVFGRGGRGDLRQIPNLYAVEDYIQTDAAINPGNSGGPLVTLEGKVIGINTFIVSSTGASVGLGFAVPERIARPVVEALMETGRVVRGHLGASIINPEDITDAAAVQAFGMQNADDVLEKFHIKKDDKGVVVARLLKGAPAEKAGIEQGDLILSIGDTRTEDVDTLRNTVMSLKPGTEVEVSLRRKGRKKKTTMVIGEQPGEARRRAQGPNKLGLSAQTLTPEIAQARGYPERVKGVIITDVEPDGPAARAGLQVDDVIMDVGRTTVSSEMEFEQALRATGDREVVFRVRRGDDTRFVTVKP